MRWNNNIAVISFLCRMSCQCLTPVRVLCVDRLHSHCDDRKHWQGDGEDQRHTQSHQPDLSDRKYVQTEKRRPTKDFELRSRFLWALARVDRRLLNVNSCLLLSLFHLWLSFTTDKTIWRLVYLFKDRKHRRTSISLLWKSSCLHVFNVSI